MQVNRLLINAPFVEYKAKAATNGIAYDNERSNHCIEVKLTDQIEPAPTLP